MTVLRASGFDAFAATPSSANLRALVTDESGSGALLFANGAIGTPSSGVLTNATGLTLAPAGALTIAAGATGSYTVTLNTNAAGSFSGTLTCTGASLTGSPIIYTLTGTVIAPPVVTNIPTLSNMGMWLMMALMLGFGVVVVGNRRG